MEIKKVEKHSYLPESGDIEKKGDKNEILTFLSPASHIIPETAGMNYDMINQIVIDVIKSVSKKLLNAEA